MLGSDVAQDRSVNTPPRSAIASSGAAGQLVARTHTRREHDQAGVDGSPVAQRHPHRVVIGGPPHGPIALCRRDRVGADADVHRDAQFGDHPAEQCTAGLVQLLGHQPRRHLDDVGMQPERAQRVGGLQAEQATADHHTDGGVTGGLCALRVCADRVEIVEGAIDVAGRQVVAGHRRNERIGAGGQHQRVVVDPLAVRGDDGLGGPIDLGYLDAQPQRDLVVTGVAIAGQREPAAVPVLGVTSETDPVVGGVGLLGQHGDPPHGLGVAGPHGLDEPMTDHAVADHHNVPEL